MPFKSVSSQVDFVALEQEVAQWWHQEQIIQKYLNRNHASQQKFSFLDGPLTANNPMGVHHAWGRTYKDAYQRFHNMLGHQQRFQNGFDEQGLWVEVEVEKELGLHTKKDILNLVPGDEFASLEKFINLCKERVAKYSAVQTEQSKRLGYFMDWQNSYHTSSTALVDRREHRREIRGTAKCKPARLESPTPLRSGPADKRESACRSSRTRQ